MLQLRALGPCTPACYAKGMGEPEGDIAADYAFTADWFEQNISVWDQLTAAWAPSRVVEVGSFEGRSACYLIETCGRERPFEIWCVDTWEGGVEHRDIAMGEVERRFDRNVALAVRRARHPVRVNKVKGPSSTGLAGLLAELGPESVDVVYIDGSHQAPDVLSDAILGFHLLRVGGMMAFDDYIWSPDDPTGRDVLQMPKVAVDAFLNVFTQKMMLIFGATMRQIYAQKTAS